MDFEIREYETMEAAEEFKAYYVCRAQASCARLATFIQNGLINSEITKNEYTIFCGWLRRAFFFSELVDSLLDYCSEHGEPDDGLTAESIIGIAEYIHREMEREAFDKEELEHL